MFYPRAVSGGQLTGSTEGTFSYMVSLQVSTHLKLPLAIRVSNMAKGGPDWACMELFVELSYRVDLGTLARLAQELLQV